VSGSSPLHGCRSLSLLPLLQTSSGDKNWSFPELNKSLFFSAVKKTAPLFLLQTRQPDGVVVADGLLFLLFTAGADKAYYAGAEEEHGCWLGNRGDG